MKFVVSRTSSISSENAPCEEALRDSIVRVETRTICTAEEFDKSFAAREGRWYDVGVNHRLNEDGYITRDNGNIEVWTMEINTLDELINFCDKYGDVLIGRCFYNPSYKEIEIYEADFI